MVLTDLLVSGFGAYEGFSKTGVDVSLLGVALCFSLPLVNSRAKSIANRFPERYKKPVEIVFRNSGLDIYGKIWDKITEKNEHFGHEKSRRAKDDYWLRVAGNAAEYLVAYGLINFFS